MSSAKRRQLEIRIIGHTPTDIEEVMNLVIKQCFPNAYCSEIKENDSGHYKFRGYITIVLSNKETEN